ncbi:hypothetical protein HDU96_006671 [Phlyctochytrium bullatum]|nr:hypothetical protein HDU96_006671 [Phlyctochytrium bullatum]
MSAPVNPPMAEPANIDKGLHLVWGSGSGPAARVQLALHEKGLEFEGHMVSFSNGDTRRAEWIARLNPRKQVPILVDNGFSVAQSLSILLYLEEKYPSHPLLPAASTHLALRTEAITRMLEADEVLRQSTRDVFKLISPDATEEARATAFKTLGDELDRWEGYLARNAEKFEGGWLVGPSLSVADIALMPYFMMFVERFGLSFGPRTRLDAWYKAFFARPSVQKSIPPHWAEAPPKAFPLKGVQL